MTSTFNTMQQIKRRFFAMRNGALAENMRRAGARYRIIFGLNIPQIVEIARDFPPDASLARQLWLNSSTRESMLLAPMLFPRECLSIEEAREWVARATTAENVDVLCHRLLKHLPGAPALADELARSERDLDRYAALRLSFNLLPENIDAAGRIARGELSRNNPLTAGVSRMLIDETEFLKEESQPSR